MNQRTQGRRFRSGMGTTAAIALASVLSFGSCSGDRSNDAPRGGGFDGAVLETVEDLSESLANDLHDMSLTVRSGDREGLYVFVSATVESSPAPGDGELSAGLPASVRERKSIVVDGSALLAREAFVDTLLTVLGGPTRAEDVRFKVKHAEFAPGGRTGEAEIKFFVVRRQADGERQWVRGTADIAVVHPVDGPWQIESFHLHTLSTMTAEQEWFSEVSDPAGLTAIFPRFGKGANEGFVSHGAAVADVNDDGLIDVAATGVNQNFLYLNDPSGVFRDVSADSFVKFTPVGSGALFVDVDNDGDKDLFLSATGEQMLLQNRWVEDRQVRFVDISNQAGVGVSANGFSVVSADVNGDGFPDIYVCSYNRYGDIMPNSWVQATNGTPNLLFINNGDGTFREEAKAWGVADSRWSYAAQFFDIDEDGDQDLYVANDFGENALYENTGGRFVDVSAAAGVVDPGFGMGVSFGDYDNDGDFDLHVTNMSSTAGNRILSLLYPEDASVRIKLEKQAEGNSLYENRGDGTFKNVSHAIGGLSGGWGFGGGFIDVDLDGRQDLYNPNGFVSGESMKDT